MIIDAWMQHPNSGWIENSMFDSLRRWRPGKWSETNQPIEATLAEMDRAYVACGMLCAWWGPSGPMISNDEVALYCRAHPGRFIGIASVESLPANGRRSRASPSRETRRFQGPARTAVGMGAATGRSSLLPAVCRMLRTRHSILYAGRARRTAQGVRARTPHTLPGSRCFGVPGASHRGRSYRRTVARRD